MKKKTEAAMARGRRKFVYPNRNSEDEEVHTAGIELIGVWDLREVVDVMIGKRMDGYDMCEKNNGRWHL